MTPPRAALAAAAVCSALVLSGCSAAAGDDDDFLDQGPRRMAKTAFEDMRETTSMRIQGSIEHDELGFTRMDISLDDEQCSARLMTDDGDIRIVKTTEGAWFQADDRFVRLQTDASDAVVSRLSGSWLVVDKRRDDAILEMCDLDTFVGGFRLKKKDTYDTIHVGEREDVGGTDAIALQGRDGEDRVTVWVAVEAPHRVLKTALTDDTGLPDELFFGSFGDPVDPRRPDPKDVLKAPRG